MFESLFGVHPLVGIVATMNGGALLVSAPGTLLRKRLLVRVGMLLFLTACANPPPFRPVVDTRQLMSAVIDPQADVLWASVGSIITEEETVDFFPRNEAEWTAVRNATVMLMESGNLLMMGERAIDDGDWMRMANDFVDAGELAFDAASKQDPDAIFAIGADVYDACNNCHTKYWVGDEERYPGQ